MTTVEIHRENTIGQVVEEFPEVVDTLLDFGVHCVGCQVSPYETIEDGFRSHGMSDEEVDQAITKLNVVLKEAQQKAAATQPQAPHQNYSLSITPLAAKKIKEFCQDNKQALRLKIKRGGCSGYEYAFDLAEQKQEHDQVFQHDGAKVYIDQQSIEKIDGATLDYKEGLTGAGFKVINPTASATCGCGKSFN